MNKIRIIAIVVFASIVVESSEDVDQVLVDKYVQLINKRSVEALKYQFPKDARMHAVTDEKPEGKSL